MKKLIGTMVGLFACIAVMAGCSNTDADFQAKDYTVDGTKIQAVEMHLEDRKIQMERSEDERIHVDYYESEKEFYDITEDGGTLKIVSRTDKGWSDYIGRKASAEKRTIVLRLPDDKLSRLSLSTTNEDVSLPALEVTEGVSISVNNGSIAFEPLSVGSYLELEAKNGDIRGTVVGGYDDFSISCQVKKGNCNLPEEKTGGEKSLTAAVNNGDIDIEISKSH